MDYERENLGSRIPPKRRKRKNRVRTNYSRKKNEPSMHTDLRQYGRVVKYKFIIAATFCNKNTVKVIQS